MEDTEEYSHESLQKCSYRFLQQTAKAMGLPSNVKKMYLIQLIHAKKYYSPVQVENLVKQVRLERQHLTLARRRAKNKKKIQQSAEISSTSDSKSPPITTTPKRVGHIMIRYSPDQYSPPKPRTNRQANCTVPLTNGTVNASDRVLRSFRSMKNPNYVLNNALIGIIKSSSSEESIKSIGRVTVSTEDKYQQVNMSSLVRKRSLGWRNSNEIVPSAASVKDRWQSRDVVPVLKQRSIKLSPKPLKRQRRLSGIYPLSEEVNGTLIPNVSVRRADGTLSKINAFIQKPLAQNNCDRQEKEPQSLLRIESIDRNAVISSTSVDNRNTALSSMSLAISTGNTYNSTADTVSNLYKENQNEYNNYENFSRENVSNIYKENQNTYNNFGNSTGENVSNIYKDQGEYTVYYHKKIRAEQVRSLRTKEMARCVSNDCKLPKINDVFTKFSSVYGRDVTQPIYVQVDSEPEIPQHQSFMYPDLHNYQTTMLENLYNLKNVFIVNQPLLQIATTTNTRCVYSTPIISTAKAQPSANVSSLYNIALSQDSPHYGIDDPRVHDFFRNYRCDEAFSDGTTIGARRCSSSAESLQSQDLGANVTIPEMVEDAFELISQDGDYMERMGMDIRMQCILCDWAGPKIILEYHIRKEHSSEIVQSSHSSWCATYTLGALAARRAWLSRVLEHAATLYVVSAKYEDPDCFCALLSTLSSEEDLLTTGSITTYNKVTGEPYTWKGIIQQLPPTLQYDNDPTCLKLELSKMDLLPNSANLKLLNRELVIRSPNKVVVGQPELDTINISLIVKLYN